MDWQGIAQKIGNFGDIMSGKESYNSIRNAQQQLGLERQKQAMAAHMQKENLQADLDKERMRTAREADNLRLQLAEAARLAEAERKWKTGESIAQMGHDVNMQQGRFAGEGGLMDKTFGQQDRTLANTFKQQENMFNREQGGREALQRGEQRHTDLRDMRAQNYRGINAEQDYALNQRRDETQHGYAKELQSNELASRERVATLIQQNVQSGNGNGMVPPELLIAMKMSPTLQVPWNRFGEMVDLKKLEDARTEAEARRQFLQNIMGPQGGITAPSISSPLTTQPSFLGNSGPNR